MFRSALSEVNEWPRPTVDATWDVAMPRGMKHPHVPSAFATVLSRLLTFAKTGTAPCFASWLLLARRLIAVVSTRFAISASHSARWLLL